MKFVTKSWIQTQFNNFASRVSAVFARKTEIPTKTSQLNNDLGYIRSMNSLYNDGYVPRGFGVLNKNWGTDGSGNPGWRDRVTLTNSLMATEPGTALDAMQGAELSKKTTISYIQKNANSSAPIEKMIPNGTDLNTLTEAGTYYSYDSNSTNTLINKPDGLSGGFRLDVICITGENWFVQRIMDHRTKPNIYERSHRGADGFKEWERIATSDDIDQINNTLKDLVYAPGDTIVVYSPMLWTTGTLTTANKDIILSIPVDKHITSSKLAFKLDGLVVRQEGKYLFDSVNGSDVDTVKTVINIVPCIGFYLKLTKDDGWGGTNNAVVSLAISFTATLS